MENPTRVIAISVQSGQIQPCIRVNRGIWLASTDHGAKFSVEVGFTYTSHGEPVGPVTESQLVSSLRYRQLLDVRNVRAQGAPIAVPSAPDSGTDVVCTAKLTITDANGNVIESHNAETTSFPVR